MFHSNKQIYFALRTSFFSTSTAVYFVRCFHFMIYAFVNNYVFILHTRCKHLVSSQNGGGFGYLHRIPASRRRRRKWNSVPGGITGPPCSYINTGTWPSRLGESRIRDSKVWSWVSQDSDPRMTVLARPSTNCKRQTCPLVREGATHQQTRNTNKNLVLGPRWELGTKTDWPINRRS
jgi:hypothetical protein